MRPASPELLLQLHRKQVLLGLPLEDENPLTNEDRARYDKIMVAMQARYAIPSLCYFLFIVISSIKTHFSLDKHTSMKLLPMLLTQTVSPWWPSLRYLQRPFLNLDLISKRCPGWIKLPHHPAADHPLQLNKDANRWVGLCRLGLE
jgi:hypothetical protein